jgi:hypothetical protein
MGWTKDAISQYKRTLEIEPNDTETMNNMAWIPGTCPEPLVRDPIRAQIEVYQSGAAFRDRRYATKSP